ncbi:TOMM system kinase/cyclase fusion protein [Burkholderia stagnalis]|uniref:TOMM system kinase/cyclase fusion protein n=1 Tax=Burkholderia stagnalis TaxID=1503054 RepID=UPI000F5910FC|nr:TOMM system kinase/cyclase fusion protein [Burkholderia stagnalis]RQQ05913.1 TOMM system kinase/cyclase fusion protein [Burkholderia stagnalis]RQQ09478.1 TOMM system kinase/cyclase fusion protein [Burkholderia stagnalis]RQQ28687.1 TOMM system kinase/cyclase fusion protein [Burkholderia stagnalis]RQQ98057.1 TOMM system kinase/cyclase fusion protein [Burkholderia stagnalis]RQX87065.1 TOMM system kinase/cyclase fusion protein [Burkholderia stagnalis]
MNAGETAVLPTALRAPVAPQMPESRQPAALPAVHPAALPAAPPAALPAAVAPFAELAGKRRYRLGPLLGEGSNGVVFRATCGDTGRDVAIKLMRDDAARATAERARRRARFQHETHLCEALRHPNIVALLDKGEAPDGRLFAVFEFVEGRTLRDWLAAQGPLSAVDTGRLMTEVLDALAAAHRRGIVHRDLKPQNIMIAMADGEPHAKLLDFGIGELLPGTEDLARQTSTQATEVLGSPQYCAPEQLRNEAPTPRSDLYAWGLVVIECLTGDVVMHGASVADILHQHLSPVDIALPPSIASHPLGSVLRRALNKNPAQRAASADELGAQFRALNFAALVGQFDASRASRPARPHPFAPRGEMAGMAGMAGTAATAGEYRQITTLCCSVTLAGAGTQRHAGTDHGDLLDGYEAQWLTKCTDIAVGYGAQVGGRLGDTLLFHFGLQGDIDRPARRAARAALDMVRVAERARLPAPTAAGSHARDEGWRVEVAAAIHVGQVLAHASRMSDLTGVSMPAAASRLMRLAGPGQILISDDARLALERHADTRPTSLRLARAGLVPQPVHELLGERRADTPFDSLDASMTAPMVGRARELDALLRAWQDVLARHRRDARGERAPRGMPRLVVGEAGIGKSRLVHELCEAVRTQGHAFAHCGCLPERENHALFPILRFIGAHWHIDADRPAGLALAAIDAMIAPLECDHAAARVALATWLGLPCDAKGFLWSSAREQHALFDVLEQLIVSLGNGAPVLLVVDDVQWIDRSTEDFLAYLRRSPRAAAIGIVLTSRPDKLDRWRGATERLALRRLSRDDAQHLVSAFLGERALDPAWLGQLAHRTAGIPLFIEAVARELVTSGAATGADGSPAGPRATDPDPLPVSLGGMLGLAFDRIDGARDTAQLAATIGLEVDAQLLADASPHDRATLDAHLRLLLEERIVYAQHRRDRVFYSFRHALIRDAAYESMPPAVRRGNHARVGRALAVEADRGGGAHAFGVAGHFARAGAFADAIGHGIDAARRALERSRYDDAIRYGQAVFDWLANADYAQREHDSARIRATLTHATMARFGWADPQVREHAEQLLRQVQTLDDQELAISALWTLSTCYHVAGDRPTVRGICTRLDALAAERGDAGVQVAADAMRGMSLWVDGHYARARAAFDAVLAGYDVRRDAGHRRILGLDTRAWTMASLASVRWCIDDDPRASLAIAHEAVHCATCLDHLPTLGVTMMYLARMHQLAGDRDAAAATSEAILRLSDAHRLRAVEHYAAIIHAWTQGDRAGIVAHLDAQRQSGGLLGLTYYASLLAELDAGRGDFAAALAQIGECLAWCESTGERYYEAQLLLKQCEYVRQADPRRGGEAARAACRRAFGIATAAGMTGIVARAEAMLHALS